jgi:hypothetical protein
MKRHIVILLLAGLLPLTISAAAQAQNTISNKENLEELLWLVGTWKGVVPAEEPVPDIVEKGDELSITMTCDEILNGNVIKVMYELTTTSGVKLVEYQGMIGWDTAQERIVSGGFDSMGGHGKAVWNTKDGEWHAEGEGANAEGTREASTLVIFDLTGTSFRSQERHRTKADETLEDAPIIEWTRSSVRSEEEVTQERESID